MTNNAKWRVARLEDLERRGRFIPVREALGIHSFGINAIKQGDDGTLINEHDESGGQEEVYVVLSGEADFEIEGESVHAGPETALRVGATTHRKILPGPEGVKILVLGGVPGEVYSPPAFTELGGPDPTVDPARIA